MAGTPADTEASTYETYQGFLKQAIKAYWGSEGRSRLTFLALLLAAREAWEVAWDEVKEPGNVKKLLTGAAGATAVALLLRTFVGGPIGLILGGASVAGLVAVYVKNRKSIHARVEHCGKLVNKYRTQWDGVRGDWADGKLRTDQRDLMMDGLMARFLIDLDADLGPEEEPDAEANAEADEASRDDRDSN
jgi:hypothetical protein